MINNVDKYIEQKIAYLFSQWQEFIEPGTVAVIDEDFRILSPGRVSAAQFLSAGEWKGTKKMLAGKPPVQFLEKEHFLIGYFCQEPPLYLIAAKHICNQHTGVLKLFTELLYRELYVKTSLNNKLKYYEDLFAAIKGITGAYIRTTENITLKRWFPVVVEKFHVQRMAVYLTNDYPDNMRNSCLYRKIDEFPAGNSEFSLPPTVQIKPHRNPLADLYKKKLKAAGSELIIREYHDHTIFFCLIIQEGITISIKDKTYLDTYIHCILLELYPHIFTNLSHVLAQQLIGTLCMELFDPLTSAHLLSDQLQESINTNNICESNSILVRLEQQLVSMDRHLKNCARINVPFPANPIIAESKALIFDALAACPELEKKYKVEKQDIQSSLFIKVLKNAFLAVICEIFKNILQHAYPGEYLKENKKLVPCITISAREEMQKLFISITNNGKKMGDPGENSRHIFEPGWKEDKSSARSGMGLAFAWFIITRIHRGSIEAESDPVKNFRITIQLPLNELQPVKEDAL